MKKTKLLCALLICGGCITASAEEYKSGFYAVANAGTSKQTLGSSRVSSNIYELGGGYEFNKNFAAEIAYGSMSSFGIATSTAASDYSVNAFHYSLLGKLPVSENFIPFVSFGRVQGTESVTTSGTASANSTSSGGRYVYGLGIEVPLEQRTALRFQTFTSTSSSTTSTKWNVFMAGLLVRF